MPRRRPVIYFAKRELGRAELRRGHALPGISKTSGEFRFQLIPSLTIPPKWLEKAFQLVVSYPSYHR